MHSGQQKNDHSEAPVRSAGKKRRKGGANTVPITLANTVPITLPCLTYCHLVWNFCRASDARKLERLQERGLRAVYKNKHASYTQLLERAKLPTLANRRLQDICILMYKVKHRLCPNSICNIFNEHTSAYNLRQSDFSTPRYNTVTYGKHSLCYVGPKLWGKLSTSDRSAKTLQAFTNCIRKRDITRLMDTGCKGCILCCT